ncbi:MAG: (d)CMP kinase [Candidatus Cloacimonetes bacterium]|nr:(d)CMP kinase [Candidatus Cloacimonadota bacterium]MBS3766593.1 (d)CMP kinase [Candidatus Cloacimonadota bacterium]
MSKNEHFVIAIDGPASSGKSTIAKNLARKLDCIYIDSGAMYRAVGLFIRENNVDVDAEKKVKEKLPEISIRIENAKDGATNIVFLNEVNVTEQIRQPIISQYASIVAKYGSVRKKLVQLQRKIAQKQSVVMDGRDIGTVVFPNADFKFFITASSKERANRRWKEIKDKGEKKSYEQVLQELKGRDKRDSSRQIAPLRKPHDAIEIDTTNLTIGEQTQILYEKIKEKLAR